MYLKLNERESEMGAADFEGAMPGMYAQSGDTQPTVDTDTQVTKVGRVFEGTSSLTSVEDGKTQQFFQSVTVASLLSWDVAAQFLSGDPGTLIQYGDLSSGVLPYGVRLEATSSTVGRVVMYWGNSSGQLVELDGPEFIVPDGVFLLVVSREFTVRGLFVRYSLMGQNSGTISEPVLDIPSGDVQPIRVGRSDSGDYFIGTVEEIRVTGSPVTHEECEALGLFYGRFFEESLKAFVDLMPLKVWGRDEDLSHMLDARVVAGALSVSRYLGFVLAVNTSPLVSFGDQLSREETMTLRFPRPLDPIQLRRDRVVAHARQKQGYSVDGLQESLSVLLDVAPEEVQVIQHGNDFFDDFSPQVLSSGKHASGHNPASWVAHEGSDTTITEPSGNDSFLAISVTAGAGSQYVGFSGEEELPPFYIRSTGGVSGLWAYSRVHSVVAPHVGGGEQPNAGIVFGDKVSDEWLWFGIGGGQLLRTTYIDGVLSAHTVVDGAWGDEVWTRTRYDGSGAFTVFYSATDLADWSGASFHTVPVGPEPWWSGFGLVDTAPGPTLNVVSFRCSRYFDHAPDGPHRHSFQVFRSPSLPGDPDIEAAELQLQSSRPAQTEGHVVETIGNFHVEDGASLTDRDPIGT